MKKQLYRVKNLKQFLNESNENVKISDGYEFSSYDDSLENQFNKGEIWFKSSNGQLYCIKRNNGFVGEVKSMWTLFYKGTYFKPVKDDKNNLMIENNGFKNVNELFEWLNPILIEHNKTFKWNSFAK